MALVAGLPVAVAVGAGVLAYAAGTGLSLLRRRRPRAERIDPFGVGERWRPFVKGALQAQARYRQTVATVAPGPLRERLEEIGRKIDRGVEECWLVAQRGHAIDGAVSTLGASRARDRLAASDEGRDGAGDPAGESVTRSLEAQVSAAGRLEDVASEAVARLRLLGTRLDEAVATAIELAMHSGRHSVEPAGGPADAGPLGTEVDNLVDELEALRSAMEETRRIG